MENNCPLKIYREGAAARNLN